MVTNQKYSCDHHSKEQSIRHVQRRLVLRSHDNYVMGINLVQDDPKLMGDSKEALIFKWSGWRFDSRCESLSLLDGKN